MQIQQTAPVYQDMLKANIQEPSRLENENKIFEQRIE